MTSCLVWQSGNFDSGSLSTEKDMGNFTKNLLNEAPNIATLVKEHASKIYDCVIVNNF